MIESIKSIAEWSIAFLEIAGIGIIVLTALNAVVYGIISLFRKQENEKTYRQIRQRLGRGILLGLEFLVAADIIQTVAVELTFKTAGVLSIVVLIRTFLSFTLEVELTGSWPWQNKG